ncbi:hypothetical protein Pla175_03310 [Pirellulimonas nuda]|uniref:DUF4864 domain-containing protein n=2 Tax=Pirellulimonas nuda TaxID=2528009 RepID=A0A518D682_9BACT|nr:hypothetical protein Pla175_03310 [Pirellulimonas nuda]
MLVAVVVGYYAGFAWWVLAAGEASAMSETAQVLVQPSPALGPADVVRLQVDALRADRQGRFHVAQCFAFASPANRQNTGPLARFAGLFGSSSYGPLVTHRAAIVGQPVVHQRVATALVTVADPGRQTVAYRFYLSKQQQAPYEECWMTDAVIRTTSSEPDDPSELPI